MMSILRASVQQVWYSLVDKAVEVLFHFLTVSMLYTGEHDFVSGWYIYC